MNSKYLKYKTKYLKTKKEMIGGVRVTVRLITDRYSTREIMMDSSALESYSIYDFRNLYISDNARENNKAFNREINIDIGNGWYDTYTFSNVKIVVCGKQYLKSTLLSDLPKIRENLIVINCVKYTEEEKARELALIRNFHDNNSEENVLTLIRQNINNIYFIEFLISVYPELIEHFVNSLDYFSRSREFRVSENLIKYYEFTALSNDLVSKNYDIESIFNRCHRLYPDLLFKLYQLISDTNVPGENMQNFIGRYLDNPQKIIISLVYIDRYEEFTAIINESELNKYSIFDFRNLFLDDPFRMHNNSYNRDNNILMAKKWDDHANFLKQKIIINYTQYLKSTLLSELPKKRTERAKIIEINCVRYTDEEIAIQSNLYSQLSSIRSEEDALRLLRRNFGNIYSTEIILTRQPQLIKHFRNNLNNHTKSAEFKVNGYLTKYYEFTALMSDLELHLRNDDIRIERIFARCYRLYPVFLYKLYEFLVRYYGSSSIYVNIIKTIAKKYKIKL